MLDELNDARNELNIVVLDACRDNPFPWKRSGSRGLQVVGNQPSDSIIVFATSAGSTAADGAGSNGLFTSHLLSNLKKPGLEVSEVFRLTMGDVAKASGNQQRPAVYNQFSGLAYLGSRPSSAAQPAPAPVPAPQPPAPTQNAKTFYDRGVQFLFKNDYETAIVDLTEAILLDHNYTNAYYFRGDAYYYKKDYDRAIADYTQAIRIDPNYKQAYFSRGDAYYEKEDYDRAIADYTQAIRIDPNYDRAYNNRGYSYYKKNEYDRAIADYTQVIRIDPNNTYNFNRRGLMYFEKKDYNRAIADFEAALNIDPNNTNAKNNLELSRKQRGY
jgi:tetratricopeptide (TPR) repeat protein